MLRVREGNFRPNVVRQTRGTVRSVTLCPHMNVTMSSEERYIYTHILVTPLVQRS